MEPCQLMLLFNRCVCITDTMLRPCLNSPLASPFVTVTLTVRSLRTKKVKDQNGYLNQGHPSSIFGKYLFGRRFEIYNFRNIICKISCLPAAPRIFEHLKYGKITLKRSSRIFVSLFPGWCFRKGNFDPYNFRITRLSARKSEQMKNV